MPRVHKFCKGPQVPVKLILGTDNTKGASFDVALADKVKPWASLWQSHREPSFFVPDEGIPLPGPLPTVHQFRKLCMS